MVAFGFLPQNFGMWWSPTNAILFYDCILRDGDNQRWWRHSNLACCNQKIELFTFTGSINAKKSPPYHCTLRTHLCPEVVGTLKPKTLFLHAFGGGVVGGW